MFQCHRRFEQFIVTSVFQTERVGSIKRKAEYPSKLSVIADTS